MLYISNCNEKMNEAVMILVTTWMNTEDIKLNKSYTKGHPGPNHPVCLKSTKVLKRRESVTSSYRKRKLNSMGKDFHTAGARVKAEGGLWIGL